MNLAYVSAPVGALVDSKYDSAILIDDNRMDLMLNRSLLKKSNYAKNLLAFLNPKNALIFLAQAARMQVYDDLKKPVVIFLDLYMPEMSGFDFLDAFEKFDANFRSRFKIYLLSNCTNPVELQRVKNCRSIYGFVPKPLSNKILAL